MNYKQIQKYIKEMYPDYKKDGLKLSGKKEVL